MSTAPLLPDRIETLDKVSERDQRLYERDPIDDVHKLTYIGRTMANYRQLAAENLGGEVPPPRKVVQFNREGWALLLALAEPAARSYFLRAAASKHIKVVEG